MKKGITIFAQAEIESEDKWKSFLENESTKISSGKYEAVVVLLQSQPTNIDYIIVSEEKLCKSTFTTVKGDLN